MGRMWVRIPLALKSTVGARFRVATGCLGRGFRKALERD